jgi:hypothetical protein
MSSASWSLQKAIHQTLTANAAVLAQLGGPHVWDHVPRGAAFPYVTIASTTDRDWSTGTDTGSEHVLTLHVWSKAAGRDQAETIAAELKQVLHDQPLTLDGHRLVNLRHELTDTRRDADGELYHGVVRLRAVTEPL